eukprot:gene10704-7436_t
METASWGSCAFSFAFYPYNDVSPHRKEGSGHTSIQEEKGSF